MDKDNTLTATATAPVNNVKKSRGRGDRDRNKVGDENETNTDTNTNTTSSSSNIVYNSTSMPAVTADRADRVDRVYIVDRSWWLPHLVRALTHHDSRIRTNAADYLLPEALSCDGECAIPIIQEVRNLSKNQALQPEQLWALVQVCLHARLKGLSEGATISYGSTEEDVDVITDPLEVINGGVSETTAAMAIDVRGRGLTRRRASGGVTEYELFVACTGEDVDLRLAGLTCLSSSAKKNVCLLDKDLSLLMRALPYSMKASQPDQRQRVLRILKQLLTRVLESQRVGWKNLDKLVKKAEKLCSSSSSSIDTNSWFQKGDAQSMAKYITIALNIDIDSERLSSDGEIIRNAVDDIRSARTSDLVWDSYADIARSHEIHMIWLLSYPLRGDIEILKASYI